MKTREKLFEGARKLTDDQFRREFPFGVKRISATLPHMLNAEWNYAWRIHHGERPDQKLKPIPEGTEPSLIQVEEVWRAQAATTRESIESSRAAGVWDTVRETRGVWEGKAYIVRAPPSEFFIQLLCHEVHHRAQVMAMLKMMGVTVQDLDYSMTTYITWE